MKERFFAAVVALIIVLPTLIKGGTWGFFALCFAACAIGTSELWRMFSAKTDFPKPLQWVLMVVYLSTFSALSLFDAPQILVLVPAVMAIWLTAMFTVNDNERGMLFAAYATFGLIYLPGLLSTFYHLRAVEPSGLLWIFLALFLPWSADSGAYFTGRSLGKNKLL